MRSPPHKNWSSLAVCVVGCLLIGAVGFGVVAADETYELTVSDAVETPSEPVTFEGDSYDIDAFAVREPGESLTVDVTAPEETDFRVDFYNADRQVETWITGEGSETVVFDESATNELDPGTYSLVLNAEANTQTIHPIVISGYDVSMSPPDEVTTNETVDLSVSVTPTELDNDPAAVEVVVWNDDRTERIDASGSDGTYSASLDFEDFDTGEYNVHAAAQGDDDYQGEQELLGLSDGHTIEVVADDDETENGDEDEHDSDPENGDNETNDEGDNGNEEDGDDTQDTEPPSAGNGENDTTTTENETDAASEESTETVTIEDTAPDNPGIRVDFETTTVQSVTFDADSLSGNITVTDRSEPPADTTAPAGSPLTIADITVPDEAHTTSAELEFTLTAANVTDADALTIKRHDAADDTWTSLSTTVDETNETMLTVRAETPGFSTFAVIEEDGGESPPAQNTPTDTTPSDNQTETPPSDNQTNSDDSTLMPNASNETDTDGSESVPEDQPGFGMVAAIGAVLLTLLAKDFYARSELKFSNVRD